jgi:outer membrane immunogenic protein
MRAIGVAIGLFLGMAMAAPGQSLPTVPGATGDAGLVYHWVRTNAQPGECGCFDLNGGGASGSWNFRPRLAAVVETSVEYAGKVPPTGNSLTLVTYLAGARYYLPQPWWQGQHSMQPFAQLLGGAGHAGGGIAGAGDASFAFASRIGGGIDLPVRTHFAVRIIQIDYDLTKFHNSVNDHQNNLLLGSGVVFRWSQNR